MEGLVPCYGTRRARKQFEASKIRLVRYHRFLKNTLSIDRLFLDLGFFLRLFGFVFLSRYTL